MDPGDIKPVTMYAVGDKVFLTKEEAVTHNRCTNVKCLLNEILLSHEDQSLIMRLAYNILERKDEFINRLSKI